MWFQSNSAGNCLFIYISRVFFFLSSFLSLAFVLKNFCYLIKSIFFSIFSTATEYVQWARKADDIAAAIFGENNTFWFPLVRHFQFLRESSVFMFAYICFEWTTSENGRFTEACLILLWWRKRSHYTKVRF